MNYTMNITEDVTVCQNGQKAQSSIGRNDHKMCVLEKEKQESHQYQNKYNEQKLSSNLDMFRCSRKPDICNTVLDKCEEYAGNIRNLKYVESVQDEHLHFVESTQSKILHPSSQFAVSGSPGVSHDSELPESWNLYAEETAHSQQELYMSNVGMSARENTELEFDADSKDIDGVAAPLEKGSNFLEKVECIAANSALMPLQEHSAAAYHETRTRSSKPDILEEKLNHEQELVKHETDTPQAAAASGRHDKAVILQGETSENYKTLDNVHRVKENNNNSKDDKETGESDNDKIKQVSSEVGEKDDGKEEEGTAQIQNLLSDFCEKEGSVESSLPVETNGGFQCHLCNKSWKFQKSLNKHMKTHKSKFPCPVCSSSFINKAQLKEHILTHSNGKFPTCPNKTITSQNLVGVKCDQSVVLRAFSCNLCFYRAKQKKDLTKHMQVHTAVKVHKCQLCKFSSKRKYSLHRHLKTVHSAARIYECTLCNLKISAFDSLKAHMAAHVSACTTSCAVCGSEIKERPNLIEHLLSHSMGLKATCKKCEQIYSTSSEYMHHLLSHKGLSAIGHAEASAFGLSTSSPLTDSAASRAKTSESLAQEKKVLNVSVLETKLSQMSTIVSRLADMTNVVTLLRDKSRVAFQLAEISASAKELALLSGNMLQPYKNTSDAAGDSSSANTQVLSSDVMEDAPFMDDEFVLSPVLDIDQSSIKEECQDNVYASMDAGMQIEVEFSGDTISCVQKSDLFRQGRSRSEHKRGKRLICTLCNLVCTDTCNLKRHLMVHLDARPYSCQICGQSFRRKEHMKKHMVTHSNERPFVCTECHYGAKTEERLKSHMLCHSQNNEFACQLCHYSGKTNYELSQHMKRHKPQTCLQCNCVCYSRAELNKHMCTHSSFDCNACNFTTTDKTEYSKHVKKHLMAQYLCCELCGYSCNTARKFKYHKLRHENKTPFECPQCDYKCSSRASFDCHRLKHAGVKPFLCSFCGSSFWKTSHLNQHMLIHKDEKAFKCDVCSYECRTKHNLKEHEMTHSGEKPYACKHCNFCSRRKKALLLHMLKHERN